MICFKCLSIFIIIYVLVQCKMLLKLLYILNLSLV